MAGPYADVPAPLATPPRVGLLSSAVVPRDPPGTRWDTGFSYVPDSCDGGYAVSVCSPGAEDRALGSAPARVSWQPYGIGVGIRCSALGSVGRDDELRAAQKLNAWADYLISRELWKGTIAQQEIAADPDFPNRWLASTDADILTESGAVEAVQGLECLESYLRDCNGGQRGMIHATRQTVIRWATLSLLRREGSVIYTINDTLVVPAPGYDGSDLDGGVGDGNVWAYATSTVELRRDNIRVSAVPESVDRSDNTIEVRAEQLAVASWDGCCHAGVRLDLDTCDPGGS